MNPPRLDVWRCPQCLGGLEFADGLGCPRCQAVFPSLGTIPCLMRQPQKRLNELRAECARYLELASNATRALEEQLGQFALLPTTRRRLEHLLAGTRENAERIMSLLANAGLTPKADTEPAASSDFSLIEHYDHILRDWSVERHASQENRRSLELVLATLGDDHELGHTLVLGAGACRLAYDLERQGKVERVVALDIGPLPLLVAERLTSGQELSLYEFPAIPSRPEAACVERTLSAPRGKAERLSFVLADAFHPPFDAGTFDTVVTPWFIDIVPRDVRESLAVIHRLLRPGGRWLNYGPLAYPHERTAGERYTLEELLELAALAGFTPSEPQVEVMPLIESAANARWRQERVSAFAAQRIDAPTATDAGGVPGWLLLSHLPVPKFEGLAGFRTQHPVLNYVAGRIDGKRTLGDLANDMIDNKGANPRAALAGTRALLSVLYQAVRQQR